MSHLLIIAHVHIVLCRVGAQSSLCQMKTRNTWGHLALLGYLSPGLSREPGWFNPCVAKLASILPVRLDPAPSYCVSFEPLLLEPEKLDIPTVGLDTTDKALLPNQARPLRGSTQHGLNGILSFNWDINFHQDMKECVLGKELSSDIFHLLLCSSTTGCQTAIDKIGSGR